MRIRVANAVGGKPAGVYGGKAEAADFWAGEVKDRSRFDKRGNPAGEIQRLAVGRLWREG